LCSINNVALKASVLITYQVCGFEKVTLTSATNILKYFYDMSLTDIIPKTEIISSSKYLSLFSIDNTFCPITNYQIVMQNGLSYSPYSKSDVSIDYVSKDIKVFITQNAKLNLFVKASSAASIATPAYLPLNINITIA